MRAEDGGKLRDIHHLPIEAVFSTFKTAPEGLGDKEVHIRRRYHGSNELREKRGEPRWKRFLLQFTDVLIIVLMIAALITFVLEPSSIDWIVITAIVVINAVIGFVQEERAEEAIANLKKLSAPGAVVIRGGRKEEIEASALVPGDVIHIEAGMRVPADGRLIESSSLSINESALTGESLADSKKAGVLDVDVPLAERANMVYMSTLVETGRGTAVVTATGMRTEIGRIADMLESAERIETPLQRRLRSLGKKLGVLVLIACGIIFVLEMARELESFTLAGAQDLLRDIDHFVELFETAVSLAVAAIPEGLPAVVTISLAIGLKVMAGKDVIVRKLPVVETLGSATVICTDKTGTLTTGTMTADRLITGGKEIEITGVGYGKGGDFRIDKRKVRTEGIGREFDEIMLTSVLCSNAVIGEEDRKVIGDTTEVALLVMAEKAGYGHGELRKRYGRIVEAPFDAERKMMTTAHIMDGCRTNLTKGAPEKVLGICIKERVNGMDIPLDPVRVQEIMENVEGMAQRGYRTLAFAISTSKDVERDMTFLGVVGIRDKVRKEAKRSIRRAKGAGIRTIMITGDHLSTASSIGKEIGLIQEESEAINCTDLEDMTEEEFLWTLSSVSVYSRASPEHKVRIVQGLKDSGEIVAMTGDGVNDAPALRMADIGVAMGITGTDVSKGASDMIITDDDFSSIVDAVEEGRGIYDNIRKVIQFLLSCNMGEVFVVFIAILLGFPLPLIALQILWMNLVTDSFPALALVAEPKERDLMRRRPRDPKESAITRDMVISIAVSTVIITAGTLLIFWYNHDYIGKGLELSRTIALTTMVMFQMWTAVASRSTTHTMMQIGWFTNRKLVGAIMLSMFLMLIIIYLPIGNHLFETRPLNVVEWAEVLTVSFFGLAAVELWEWANRNYFHYGASAR